jgi:cholesterol oxidase
MTDIARALGGELRTNPAWAFLGKPITVHNQGGCRMSDDPALGVTTPEGRVWGCEGLFVLDGSILCAPVGVNPSATIAALAEHGVLAFIRSRYPGWPEGYDAPGAREYAKQRDAAAAWAAKACASGWALRPPDAATAPPAGIQQQPVGLKFDEVMDGYYALTESTPASDDAYRQLETRGRPGHPLRLTLDVSVDNLAAFFEDPRHSMRLTGSVSIRLPHAHAPAPYRIRTGTLQLFVPRYKRHAISEADQVRRKAQAHAARKPYDTRPGTVPRRVQRFMNYDLDFLDEAGDRWAIRGYKRIRDDPSLDAWRDASSLFVQLVAFGADGAAPVLGGAGVVHVELGRFLFDQLRSLTVLHTEDPARRAWAMTSFASFFFGTLLQVAAPEVLAAAETFFVSPQRREADATARRPPRS